MSSKSPEEHFGGTPDFNKIHPSELAEFYEQKEAAQEAAQNLYFRTVVECPVKLDNKPKHTLAKACMACRHCRQQDEVHPDGIVLMPDRYYLCIPCLALFERKKFFLLRDGVITCRACVMEEAERIARIDPANFKDLRGDTDAFAERAFAMSLGLI